jgi:hypothetical protein
MRHNSIPARLPFAAHAALSAQLCSLSSAAAIHGFPDKAASYQESGHDLSQYESCDLQ